MFLTPQQQLNRLEKGKVKERLVSCIGYYAQKFQTEYRDIHMDVRLLRHAVEVSLLDILDFKEFHGFPYADRHKRAAFLMYWVARIKPIQIESDAHFTPALGVVYETYAILLGLNHLNIGPGDLPEGYLKHLLYALHRGHTNCVSLAREMFLLEKLTTITKKES